ncbi:MAG: transcriptional antiterminator NusG [Pelagibacterales bacterium]|nr:transcriptional antiterminator NusG [Pelagibacterales bacterium]
MNNWYIVQTFSGFEQKVADVIKDTIKTKNLEDKITDVLVPIHEVTEVKRGKRVKRKKKFFPSYVLVKMEMRKDLYHMIKNIQKVTGFLGTTGTPVAVSDKEIDKILGNIKEGSLVPEPSVTFDIGESVKVCEGPFASFTGLVEEVDEEKSRLKVSVSIFGRPTPIELEYNQVEKS